MRALLARRPTRARRHGPRALVVGLVLVGVLAGCQSLGGSGDAGGSPDPGPGGRTPSLGGADTPVLVVRAGGGFVPMGYDFSAVPTLAVYGDGSVVVPGPQTLIYPGPALPNLQVEHLSDADLTALVAAATDAGLLGPAPDYGMPNVTDLPTTRVSITVGGRTYEHAAYALGFADGGSAPEGDSGLTPAQADARRTLLGFLARADALVAAAGDGEAYPITALAVLARAVDPAAGAGDVEGVEPSVVPWPLDDVALAEAGECRVVDGADAAALLGVLAQANQLTRYTQGGTTYGVWFRPLLPHERVCADLGFGAGGS